MEYDWKLSLAENYGKGVVLFSKAHFTVEAKRLTLI
jgi:hypothetical protein